MLQIGKQPLSLDAADHFSKLVLREFEAVSFHNPYHHAAAAVALRFEVCHGPFSSGVLSGQPEGPAARAMDQKSNGRKQSFSFTWSHHSRGSMTFLTDLGRLRLAGLVEGISFILLLFIAMPLKYAAGRPEFVRVIGMAHGILFILYILFLIRAAAAQGWGFGKMVILFVSTLVPFGTFAADYWILAKESTAEPASF